MDKDEVTLDKIQNGVIWRKEEEANSEDKKLRQLVIPWSYFILFS